MLSHVTPRSAACQAPLSMDFSRQEYWSGLPFLSPYNFFKKHTYVTTSTNLSFTIFHLILPTTPEGRKGRKWLFLLIFSKQYIKNKVHILRVTWPEWNPGSLGPKSRTCLWYCTATLCWTPYKANGTHVVSALWKFGLKWPATILANKRTKRLTGDSHMPIKKWVK